MKRIDDDLVIGDMVEDQSHLYRVVSVCDKETVIVEIDPKKSPRSYLWAAVAAVVTSLIYFLILGDPS